MRSSHFDHHIQAKIFAKLRYNTELRYKDLKDPELEPSQFMYHMKELIRQKIVTKTPEGTYRLTGHGSELAQHFSSEAQNIRLGVLCYSLVFLRSDKGRWLVSTRRKHPHIHKYACISGKVHTEETLEQAAERELAQFTGGVITTQLVYKGSASVMVETPEYTTHIYGPVWFGDNVPEAEVPDVPHATSEWVDWKTLPYEKFIPGWKEIVEMIEKGSNQLLDLRYRQ